MAKKERLMEKKDRVNLIKQLQTARGSNVIVYMTSDRNPANLFSAQIALDVIPMFYDHLRAFKECKKITLLIYSAGGSLEAPWPIVNLIREYCSEFELFVPFKALSAATLIGLGANKIVMTPLSMLSPVDPSGHFKREGKQIDIQVEDVQGFIDLAKEKIGIAEQQALTEVLRSLVGKFDPDILGSLNRTFALIRRLSENLLRLHLKEMKNINQVEQIVENMTQKLFSHNHMITRKEAKDAIGFGEMIEFASEDEERIANDIRDAYFKEMEINIPFDPKKILKDKESELYTANRAFLESENLSHVFATEFSIKKEADEIKMEKGFDGWKESTS